MTELITPIPPGTQPRTGSRPRTGWRRLPVLVGAGLLTGLLLTGGTFAFWNDDDEGALGQITAGNLDIQLVGETVWNETSGDVEVPQRDLDPMQFLVRPGDSVRITQNFTTTLQGENMLAVLGINWADDGADLHDDVTATYVVLDNDGGESGTALVGQPVELPAIAADNDGRTDQFTLQIDLTFADTEGSDRFGSEDTPVVADLGTVVIGLEQVREGEGYTP